MDYVFRTERDLRDFGGELELLAGLVVALSLITPPLAAVFAAGWAYRRSFTAATATRPRRAR